MNLYDELYNAFLKALRYHLEKEGHGGGAVLAANAGISSAMLSKMLKNPERTKASLKTQIALAKVCGYEHTEFIDLGRKLLSENEKEIRNFEFFQPDEKNESPQDIDPIICEHIEIVKKFRHKEQAKKINENLLVIDQNPEAMRRVEAYIEGLADGIRLSMGASETARPNQQNRQAGKLKNGTED